MYRGFSTVAFDDTGGIRGVFPCISHKKKNNSCGLMAQFNEHKMMVYDGEVMVKLGKVMVYDG